MSLSNTYENHVLNALFRNTAASEFTSMEIVQLATGAIAETDSLYSSVKTPPTASGYANKSYVASPANWRVQESGVGYLAKNLNSIQFNTATGPWGTITHFALSEISEASRIIAYGTLNDSKTVSAGDIVVFNSGELKLTIV